VLQGATWSDGVYSVEYDLDYIEVPLLIKGRYWFGPASTGSGEPDAKNRSWMLTLGYQIPVR
jgi:hypothetical protein